MSIGRLLAACEHCGSVACQVQAPNRCRHTGIVRLDAGHVSVASVNTPTVPRRVGRGRPPKHQQGSQAA